MKARDVYHRALALLAEQDSDGTNYDTEAFEIAAPSLINVLSMMLDELDLHIKSREFHEATLEPRAIESLDEEVTLHPVLCASVLPLGLAFLLIAEEDARRASLFFNLYEAEKTALFARFKKGKRHKITSVYG